MVTLVGIQTEFEDALKDLIELDYDAVEAYDAAINRLENQDFKEKLNIFKADHEWHIQELSSILKISSGIELNNPKSLRLSFSLQPIALKNNEISDDEVPYQDMFFLNVILFIDVFPCLQLNKQEKEALRCNHRYQFHRLTQFVKMIEDVNPVPLQLFSLWSYKQLMSFANTR